MPMHDLCGAFHIGMCNPTLFQRTLRSLYFLALRDC
jgi:hypothetical protein